jgi:peptide subunit release factor RF-3
MTNQQEFYEKYPELFERRHLSMQESCMYWGIDLKEEYRGLLHTICQMLQEYNKDKAIEHKVVFEQIKMKWGRPAFYFHSDADNKETYYLLLDKIEMECKK